MAMYETETWTLREVDERRVQAREIWISIKMAEVSWVKVLKNEEILKKVGTFQ